MKFVSSKNFCLVLFSFFFFQIFAISIYADYVLPYPSYMPGNRLYRVSRLWDQLKMYWHWGSMASVKYRLGLADKYLVEAKTLFEYRQYLLAVDALERSNRQFLKLSELARKVKSEGKETSQLQRNIKEAALAHENLLERLVLEVPSEFTWTPEKSSPAHLALKILLEKAVEIRTQVIADMLK